MGEKVFRNMIKNYMHIAHNFIFMYVQQRNAFSCAYYMHDRIHVHIRTCIFLHTKHKREMITISRSLRTIARYHGQRHDDESTD